MKYLLIFIPFLSYSQDTGRLPRILDSTTTSISYPGFSGTTGVVLKISQAPPDEHKKDTVKTIMLVCDTSLSDRSLYWVHGFAENDITISKKGWRKEGIYEWYQKEDYQKYSTSRYLDDKKRPLPKEIVVWQVK